MTSTRFNRTATAQAAPGATPAAAPPTAVSPAAAHSPADTSDLLARHQELQQRAQQLAQRRLRREVQLESVHAADAALRQQAEALGVATPEELHALIERQEQEDREALDRFEAELNAEAERLDAVDRELSALDGGE